MKTIVLTWLVGLQLVLAGGVIAAPRPLELDDLHTLQEVSDPHLSPDGRWVAYVVTRHNREHDLSQSRIWLARSDGSERRPASADLVAATESQRMPRWAQGDQLFFLSDAGESGEQIRRLTLHSGAVETLTELPAGVSDYAVAPGGDRLAVIAIDPEPAWPAANKGTTAAPLVTERYQFMDGDDGVFLDARRSRLHVVDIGSREVKVLSPTDADIGLPAWSPDGKWLAYVSKRGADPDRHSNFDLFMVPADGSDIERQLTDYPGQDLDPYWATYPAWSPDGKRIAFLRGGDPKYAAYAPAEIAIVDVHSGAVSQPAVADRFHYGVRWRPDGKALLALREEAERTHLIEVDLERGAVNALTDGARFVSAFDIAADGRVALLTGDVEHPAEVFALSAGAGSAGLLPLSRVNEDWLVQVRRVAAEEIKVTTADGVELHGLLLRPPGVAPGHVAPLLVRLHGGPVYQFSHEFAFDMQWFASRGFAVLAVNPRGSSGRGLDFSRAIYGDWGRLDVQDVLAMVDHVVRLGGVDPQQMVIGGHSYGGYLTNYVIASDTRFKAAYSSAGASNSLGLYGTDMYVRDYEMELGLPWRNLDAWLRVSYPFFKADRIATPTLFLCNGNDFNVPCAGAQQMYQALRSLGTPTRLIRFPNQGHTLTVPSYLEFRLRSYLDWFQRHLGR